MKGGEIDEEDRGQEDQNRQGETPAVRGVLPRQTHQLQIMQLRD